VIVYVVSDFVDSVLSTPAPCP